MELSLPLLDTHDITICAFFSSHITRPKKIALYERNDSLKSFVRVLKAARADKEYDIIHALTPHAIFLTTGSH